MNKIYHVLFLTLLVAFPVAVSPAVRNLPTEFSEKILQEKGAALLANRVQKTSSGYRVMNRKHSAEFSEAGISFQARQGGPSWSWSLQCMGPASTVQHNSSADQTVPVLSARSEISYPHKQITEKYILKKTSIEQQFIIPKKIALQQDLVIRGVVTSDGTFEEGPDGWLWRGQGGVVSLGKVTVFDATGQILPACMNTSATSTEIIVDGLALSQAAYPVTIDPEIGTDDFRVSDMGTDGDPAADAFDAAIAYNSVQNEYLVVWSGDDSNPKQFEIYGQFIDGSTGNAVGSNDFRISDMGADPDTAYGAFAPNVAFSSASNEFLVVWSGDDNQGTLVDGELEIFGQRIDGITRQEVGDNDFRLSDMGTDGNASFDAFAPAVAYNSTENEYLVVWHGDNSGIFQIDEEFEIFGQRVDAADGSEQGANDFQVSNMGFSSDTGFEGKFPGVAYNSVDNQYLVVWRGDESISPLVNDEFEIFGQRLDGVLGSATGNNDFRISDMGPNGNIGFGVGNPSVTYNSAANEYLVVWPGFDNSALASGDEFETFGQRLAGASGAEVGDNDFRLSDMGPDDDADFDVLAVDATYNGTQNEYLVVWQGDDNSGSLTDDRFEIFAQRLLGSDGSETGDNDFQLSALSSSSAAAFGAFAPVVSFNDTDNEFLIAWHGRKDEAPLVDGETEIFGQRFTTKVAPNIFVVTNTDDSGAGSLRQALLDANAAPNTDVSVADQIEFNIPTTDPGYDPVSATFKIAPLTELPAITEKILLDALTQPNASCASWPPNLLIELDGSNLSGPLDRGLVLQSAADGSTVRGFVINRFPGDGLVLVNSDDNAVECNFLGTDVSGQSAAGNRNGLLLDEFSTDNRIGGSSPARRNLISGNIANGITNSEEDDRNTIQGNFIGVDVTGSAALANGENGIYLWNGASENQIGGTAPKAGNLISGNSGHGIMLEDFADNNIIEGNYVGTDSSGSIKVENAGNGLLIVADAIENRVGGPSAAGNLFSGNGQNGIQLDFGADSNTIEGNLIGTAADGTAPLGNTGNGVLLVANPEDNSIGGTQTGAGNTIAYNNGDGVRLLDEVQGSVTFLPSGNRILGNAIFANGGLGINLNGNAGGVIDVVTSNDPGDGDGGPNSLQNYPELSTVILSLGSVAIEGSLISMPNTNGYRIEFFANTICNADVAGQTQADQFGEGSTFLGFTTVNTDANGDASFSANFTLPGNAGEFITATATSPDNNTSEFGPCEQISSVQVATISFPPIEDAQIKVSSSDNFGSKATAKVEANKFRTYLKFDISGIVNIVVGARLKLQVADGADDGSDSGGVINLASNNFDNSIVPWTEGEVNSTNSPQEVGPPLSILGAVTRDTSIEFDLGAAVPGDGVYSFCITSNSSDQVKYLMKEGISPPQLLVDVATTVGNLVPQAEDDNIVTQINQAISFEVTANDVDLDGSVDKESIVVVSSSTSGTAQFDGAGFFTYTPNSDFTGTDSFRYTVDDNDAETSNIATVTITVTPPNQSPVAVNDNVTVEQDTPLQIDVLANDSDSDGSLDQASVVLITPPVNGNAKVNSGSGRITYTPDSGFFGVDTFTYTVTDNVGALSNEATVVLSVKKGAQLITLQFQPTDDGQVRHTAAANNYGAKQTGKVEANVFTTYFKFNVSGLTGVFQNATLRLQVTDGESDGSNSGGSLHAVDNDFSTQNDPWNEETLNFQNAPRIDTPPLRTLGSVQPNQVIEFDLSAIVNQDGVYSFALSSTTSNQVKYFMKEHGTNQPTLLIETLSPPANTDPIAANEDAVVGSGQSVTIDVVANDTDLDGILDLNSVTITSPPGNGTAQVQSGTGEIVYAANFGFSGQDSFTYTVGDNEGGTSNAATVSVEVRDNSPWSTLATGTNDRVRAIAVSGSDVYVGGDFTEAGGVPANFIAKWDGNSWSALGTGLDGSVRAIAVNDTDVYVGGKFQNAGGAPASFIAKWDGASWSSLGSGMDAPVQALAIKADSLFAGGEFSTADGNSAMRVAKWDGAAWSSLATGVNDTVKTMVCDGNDLFVGGTFNQASGITTNFIARWDGSTWHDLSGGTDGVVRSLTAANGRVYAAGNFASAGVTSANNIAAWNGTSWEALTPTANNSITALAANDALLFAAGTFTSNNQVRDYIQKWDGAGWTPLGTGTDGSVLALAISGRSTFAGGSFTTAGGLLANGIAEWVEPNERPVARDDAGTIETGQIAIIDVVANDSDPDGTIDNTSVVIVSPASNGSTTVDGASGRLTYSPNTNFEGTDTFQYSVADNEGLASNPATVTVQVNALDNSRWSALGSGVNIAPRALAIDGNDVYVGGTFTTAGGQSIQKIARWDGGVWSALGSGSVIPSHSTVFAVASGDSGVFIGGDFNSVDGKDLPYLARFHNNAWDSLGTGVNNRVNAVALQDSNVYVGGIFNQAGGVAVSRIAKWDGHAWSALGSGLGSTVLAIAADAQDIYVGGHFTTAGGATANRIAKWDGSAWSSLGAGVDNIVTAIALDGSDVYVVGNFTTAGGISANRIAKWDGNAWSTLDGGLDNDVHDIGIDGAKIFVTGRFATAGPVVAPFVAQWDGSKWLNLGSGLDNTGWTIAAGADQVFVGGDFTQAGDKSAAKIALWGNANLLPVAQDDQATTSIEQPVAVNVIDNDSDPDGSLNPASVNIATSPANGTAVAGPNGSVTYTPANGFIGQDTFTYTVLDNLGARSNVATVAVTVNDQQVLRTFTFVPTDDGQVKVTSAERNYGSKTTAKVEAGKFNTFFKFNLVGLPGNVSSAKLQLVAGDNENDGSSNGGTVFSVSNSFSSSNGPWTEDALTASNAPEIDGNGLSTLGAVQPSATVEFDVSSAVSGNGVLSFAITSTSLDQVKYFMKEGTSPPKLLVTALSTGGNTPPVARDDTVEVVKNVSGVANILANDTDLDGAVDHRTISITTPPANGTVGVNPNSGIVTYTPNVNFQGQDSFVYTVKDEQGATSNAATVVLNVGEVAAPGPGSLTLNPTDDTYVRSSRGTTNYGDLAEMVVRKASAKFRTFLKFDVQGITAPVTGATLRLFVGDASGDGGRIFVASNNLNGSTTAWTEENMVWDNAPDVDGTQLSSLDAVTAGEVVNFDVTSAINADGTVSFAIVNSSVDAAKYQSKEGANPPELIVNTGTVTAAASGLEETVLLSVEETQIQMPTEFALQQNYPNPFNPETTIRYALPEEADVNIRIYNVVGQLVRTLVDEKQKAGFKNARWAGKNDQGVGVSSGIYFVRMNVNQHRFVNRILLQK